ncbi:MAG TPA: adenylate/guanylate cyclase domain-containing protein [Micropepsaceae bacterium]|nr:adenylate/guanylate cyclase domain-containing protein [Micropepsaceae bacterium]
MSSDTPEGAGPPRDGSETGRRPRRPFGRALAAQQDRVDYRHLARAFRGEERTGLMLGALVRVAIALALTISAALGQNLSGDAWLWAVGSYGFLAVTGGIQFLMARAGINPPALKYVWVLIDCAYLAAIIAMRNPFVTEGPPPSAILREGTVLYFFIFLVQASFAFSPRLVLWCGFCVVAAWTAVMLYVLGEPGIFWDFGAPGQADLRVYAAKYANPFYVPLSKWIIETAVVILLSGALSVSVSRSRRLVGVLSKAERARSNLARHFSPNLVETLSERDEPFGAVRRQNAAVLFADIRGFTSFAESAEPEEVVNLLRGFHARAEHEIFEAGGTLDKIIGDGLMATFGAPVIGVRDSARALACARNLINVVDRWNIVRGEAGLAPVNIGVGIHYGPVVLGDVGSERRLSFEVIGDTVNTASRLQTMCKEKGARLVVSGALLERIHEEGGDNLTHLFEGLVHEAQQSVRGRGAALDIHYLV